MVFGAVVLSALSLSVTWRDFLIGGTVSRDSGWDALSHSWSIPVGMAVVAGCALWQLIVPPGLYREPVTQLAALGELFAGAIFAYEVFSYASRSLEGIPHADYAGIYIAATAGIVVCVGGLLEIAYPQILDYERVTIMRKAADPGKPRREDPGIR